MFCNWRQVQSLGSALHLKRRPSPANWLVKKRTSPTLATRSVTSRDICNTRTFFRLCESNRVNFLFHPNSFRGNAFWHFLLVKVKPKERDSLSERKSDTWISTWPSTWQRFHVDTIGSGCSTNFPQTRMNETGHQFISPPSRMSSVWAILQSTVTHSSAKRLGSKSPNCASSALDHQ